MDITDLAIVAMCILGVIASILFIQTGINIGKAADDIKAYGDIETNITIAIVYNNASNNDVKELIKNECISKELKISSTKECIAFEYQKFLKIDVR